MIRRTTPVLAGLSALLAALLAAPFLAGLAQAGAADWRGADAAAIARATGVSVASASAATILSALGGVPLGYVLARTRRLGLRALGVVVQLPLALPPLASGVLLLFLIGPGLHLGRWLTDSLAGVVLSQVFVAAPFLVVASRSAFAAIDPALVEVAATLGHRAGARFRRVALPLAWPGIRAGLLLTWLRAFGEFGATILVAYHPQGLPVHAYVAFGSRGLPAMLPVILPAVVVALAAALAFELRRPVRVAVPAEPDDPGVAQADTAGEGGRLAVRVRRRLAGFDLDVDWAPTGRRLAVLGVSGSGKSTLLRLIAGLDWPEAGKVVLDGRDLTSSPPEARRIGYVPQGEALLPHLRLRQQFRFPVGVGPAAAEAWMRRLGLDGLAQRRPHELSAGQRQRAVIGRTLARPTRLLLLDEPFSALDTGLRRRMQREMLRLQRGGLTTLLVTHDPDEALLLADELLLIADGHVIQAGPAATLFMRPASEAAARLLGADWTARGVSDGAGIDVGQGVCLPVPVPAGPVGWTVRSDWLRVHPDGAQAAEVASIEPASAILRLGDALVTVRRSPGCVLSLGPCRLDVPAERVQAWPCRVTSGDA